VKGKPPVRHEASDTLLLHMRLFDAQFYTASWQGRDGRTTAALVAVDDPKYATRLMEFIADLEQEEEASPIADNGGGAP